MKLQLFSLPALLVCLAVLSHHEGVDGLAFLTDHIKKALAAAKAAQLAKAAKPLPPAAVAPAPTTHKYIDFHDVTDGRLKFDVKHYQKKIKFNLKHKPKGKVTVFLQGDNLQFNRCAVTFTESNYKKPQEVYVTAAPYFTDAAVDRNLNIRFAMSAPKDEKLNKKEDVLPVVREKGSGAVCQASGDPHYRSFAGRCFDFQGVGGPFTLVRSKRLTVQFITKKWVNSAYVNDAVAIRYNDVVFVVCSKTGLTVFDPHGIMNKKTISGKPLINIMQSKRGGDTKFRDYRFHFPDGNAVDLAVNHAHMDYIDITVKLACHMQGDVKGICGAYEGTPNAKFIKLDNKVTENPHEFGESYRKPFDKSLFHCAKAKNCKLEKTEIHGASTCIIPPIKDVELDPVVGYEVAPTGYEVATKIKGYDVEIKVEPKPKKQPNMAPTEALSNAAKAACGATFAQFKNNPVLKPDTYERNCIADVVLSGKFQFVDQHKTDYLEMLRTLTKTLAREPIAAVASAVKSQTIAVTKKMDTAAKDAAKKVVKALESVAGYGLGKKECPKNCSGNGKCLVDGCKCKPGYTGLACEVDLNQYAVAKEEAYTTEPAKPPKPFTAPPPPIKYVVQEATKQIKVPKGGYVIDTGYSTGSGDESSESHDNAEAASEEPPQKNSEEGGEEEEEAQEEEDDGTLI